jgi:3-hydroxyisobutyrate dehydrogenase-like beta-hydroxyacid dehydrogenase
MKVTLLGLGLMGQPMALRLQQCGHEVVVWNRSGEPLQKASEAGLTVQADLVAAIDAGEMIILTLSDGEAIDAVLFGDQAPSSLQGKTVFKMGTIAPN